MNHDTGDLVLRYRCGIEGFIIPLFDTHPFGVTFGIGPSKIFGIDPRI